MARRNGDLLAAALLAGAGALVVQFAGNVPTRLIFVVPLLLILPGYVVSAAIFGRERIGLPHLLLLSLGLSLSTDVVGAVVLHLLPFGLRSRSWSVFAVCVVWGAGGIAARRRAGTGGRIVLPRPRLGRADAILLLAAVLIAAGAVAFARTPLPAKNVQGFTALWLLPASDAGALHVGVTSAELHGTMYRLEVRTRGGLLYGRRLSLEPGQKWEQTIELPPGALARRSPVMALLYRSDEPRVYRSVRIWLRAGVN